MAKAVYIHIPFCTHICHYCDFNKVFLKGQPVDRYIDALILEIEKYIEQFVEPIETIFLGGGTPTALTTKQLDHLLTDELKVPVFIAENPMNCVAVGTGVLLENIDKTPKSRKK